jgi:hypothetical protein
MDSIAMGCVSYKRCANVHVVARAKWGSQGRGVPTFEGPATFVASDRKINKTISLRACGIDDLPLCLFLMRSNALPRLSYTIDTDERGTFVGYADHEARPAAEAAHGVLQVLATDLRTRSWKWGSIKMRV